MINGPSYRKMYHNITHNDQKTQLTNANESNQTTDILIIINVSKRNDDILS